MGALIDRFHRSLYVGRIGRGSQEAAGPAAPRARAPGFDGRMRQAQFLGDEADALPQDGDSEPLHQGRPGRRGRGDRGPAPRRAAHSGGRRSARDRAGRRGACAPSSWPGPGSRAADRRRRRSSALPGCGASGPTAPGSPPGPALGRAPGLPSPWLSVSSGSSPAVPEEGIIAVMLFGNASVKSWKTRAERWLSAA